MTGILNLLMGTVRSAVATDPYFEYTTLLLPGSGTNGTQNNSFVDSSANAFPITRNPLTGPNAPTQGTFSPFSQTGWGGYASSTGQYLTAAGNAAFALSNSDFTIEGWIYLTALNTYNFFYNRTSPSLTEIEFSFSSTGSISAVGYVGTGQTAYAAISSSGVIVTNRWQHVAAVRSGGTLTVYVDGASVASNGTLSTSSFYDPGTSYGPNILNQAATANRGMQGYCSNFRLAIGVAVYTGTFTPPTSPLTATQSSGTNISAITGTQTKILTFQSNRFIDNSVANSGAGWTLTVNGSLSVRAFSPFNPTASWSAATYGGSGYFDGSGDWINPNTTSANLALGSGDFTIEFWLYTPRGATRQYIYDFRNNGSTGTISPVTAPILIWGDNGADTDGNWLRYTGLSNGTIIANADLLGVTLSTLSNQWNHIAVVRSSGTVYGYLNGVRKNSVADSTNYNVNCSVSIAAAFNGSANYLGNISDFRVVKGTAVYTGTTYTVPTAPLTAITNTSLLLNFTNAGIYDATSKNDLETVADAQINNTTAKWGSTSIKFDGTGDYLQMPDSELVEFGSADFTIEAWVYPTLITGANRVILGHGTSGTQWLAFYIDANGYLTFAAVSSSAVIDRTATSRAVSLNTWTHVAVSRSGSTFRLFIDGSEPTYTGSPSTTSSAMPNFAAPFRIGAQRWDGDSGIFQGYVQDMRITKYARYTANFTAPTAAFPTL